MCNTEHHNVPIACSLGPLQAVHTAVLRRVTNYKDVIINFIYDNNYYTYFEAQCCEVARAL